MTDPSPAPFLRVMALHSLAYCERLFYLEEVEEIRVADASVYAGRRLHEEISPEPDETESRTFELCSEDLGLMGKVDAVRRRDGAWVVYEHKRGRPNREGKDALPWPSDRLQVGAYAMLLEEELGERVSEGRIRYHTENVTVRVTLDDELRSDVRSAITRANELARETKRPSVADNPGICRRCSLAPVCLPEEERLASGSVERPIRLFPAEPEREVLHVSDPSARISSQGETLVISSDSGKETVPLKDVEALVIHGYPQLTTQTLHKCAAECVQIHWVGAGGHYVACTAPGAPSVHRRLRQFEALRDSDFALGLSKRLAEARISSQIGYLQRKARSMDASPLNEAIGALRASLREVPKSMNAEVLRGYEGIAGRAYFSTLPHLLREEVPEEFRFEGRNRRPPKDRFNALLGFGYSLLYQAVLRSILAVGLDPAVGFYHTARSSAHPLVLDLMELFRVYVWDMTVVSSLNRLQWDKDADFAVAPGRVWLSREGRRKAIELFEERLGQKWKHPATDYSLSYSRIIELEARLFEKEWTGTAGLFAKMKLR